MCNIIIVILEDFHSNSLVLEIKTLARESHMYILMEEKNSIYIRSERYCI